MFSATLLNCLYARWVAPVGPHIGDMEIDYLIDRYCNSRPVPRIKFSDPIAKLLFRGFLIRRIHGLRLSFERPLRLIFEKPSPLGSFRQVPVPYVRFFTSAAPAYLDSTPAGIPQASRWPVADLRAISGGRSLNSSDFAYENTTPCICLGMAPERNLFASGTLDRPCMVDYM